MCAALVDEEFAPSGAVRCAVDLDPLAGAKMKAINSAVLLAEVHPVEPGRILVMVAAADGVVTIWEGEDSRCATCHVVLCIVPWANFGMNPVSLRG